MSMTATYSPEDNKLRLYSSTRLDSETYARVKAEGFKWAPKQELFVAPMWTPSRAALLIELCGEIGDEDTGLIERAEECAERFEEYSEKREADAHAVHEAVARVANGIPLGQPILVGHHSEKRARKDAERIKAGMQRAVNLWETSKYWTDRAKGAIRHAKYKERPDVRHRRIKGLEADKRKQEKAISIAEGFAKMWGKEGLTVEKAAQIANFDHINLPPTEGKPYGDSLWSALTGGRISAEDAAKLARERHAANVEHARQWLQHIDNRLAYERAMLDETGGTPAARFPFEVGGRVLSGGWRKRHGYLVITRINKAGDVVNSVSTTEGVISVEDVEDYRSPEAGDADKVKAAKKLPPLVNYPGEGFIHMAKAEWDRKPKDYRIVRVQKATETRGAHRCREAFKPGGSFQTAGVYLTDAKRTDPPAPEASAEPVEFEHVPGPIPVSRSVRAPKERTVFDDMKDSIKSGVTAVSAPQLFPTPPDLAARMVREADVAGCRVLEPSAGAGAILRELVAAKPAYVAAVEVDARLAETLRKTYHATAHVVCEDFLTYDSPTGGFDRIVMNPPFADGQDVEHVNHAYGLLAQGGRLVSVMSAGVEFRQDKRTEAFRRLVESCGGTIEKLPDDTFKDAGTSVRTVLVTVTKP